MVHRISLIDCVINTSSISYICWSIYPTSLKQWFYLCKSGADFQIWTSNFERLQDSNQCQINQPRGMAVTTVVGESTHGPVPRQAHFFPTLTTLMQTRGPVLIIWHKQDQPPCRGVWFSPLSGICRKFLNTNLHIINLYHLKYWLIGKVIMYFPMQKCVVTFPVTQYISGMAY